MGYVAEHFPEFFHKYIRLGQNSGYIDYMNTFIHYNHILNWFETSYIDAVSYALIVICYGSQNRACVCVCVRVCVRVCVFPETHTYRNTL